MKRHRTPPTAVFSRNAARTGRWELGTRYTAATMATLISVAGAQLVVANNFIVLLVGITLAGVPVSLYLRHTDMHIFGVPVPRAAWNSLTVFSSFLLSLYCVFWSLKDTLLESAGSASPAQSFWLRFSAGDTVALLMQVFLLFAACRSFALITDKDATHTLVPSFSVLLLLLPVQKDIAVVIYFFLWTVVATVLLALDHRSDVRASAAAYVPSLSPDDEVRLSSRSLAGVLTLSLVCAAFLSYTLSLRQPDQRSNAEYAVTALATRLTQYALSLPDVAINGGPERQIDFSSGPSLPSHSALWRVEVFDMSGKLLHPSYFRMFTLTQYDGRTWSQPKNQPRRVTVSPISMDRWPRYNFQGGGLGFTINPAAGGNDGRRGRDGAGASLRQRNNATVPGRFPPTRNLNPFLPSASQGTFTRGGGNAVTVTSGGFAFRPSGVNGVMGFDFAPLFRGARGQYGKERTRVRVNLSALVPNLGTVPCLPYPDLASLRESTAKEVRFRADGAVDMGIVPTTVRARVVSLVPQLPEYGLPTPRGGFTYNPAAKLTARERTDFLGLPDGLPQRVRDYGRSALKFSKAREDNYRKAQRLVLAIQEGAVYTLHPPQLPAGVDAVDYFLFDSHKRGYCTYFAGALTVLCRTQNIPARLVSGFVNPEWDKGSAAAVLREANAHAWTEVWVEGFGWRPVDATPSDDRGNNSSTWLETWADVARTRLLEVSASLRKRIVPITAVAIGALLLATVGPLRLPMMRRRGKLGLEAHPDDLERQLVMAQYRHLSRRLTRQFRARANWETPREWLAAAGQNAPALRGEALSDLTELYLWAAYNPAPMPEGSGRVARELVAAMNHSRRNQSADGSMEGA